MQVYCFYNERQVILEHFHSFINIFYFFFSTYLYRICLYLYSVSYQQQVYRSFCQAVVYLKVYLKETYYAFSFFLSFSILYQVLAHVKYLKI